MRLWLDDVRLPPRDQDWTHVEDAESLLKMVREVGLANIEEISFDNDLGTGKMEGYQALTEIERMVVEDGERKVPVLWPHSANPVAVRRMMVIIDRILTHVTL